MNSRSVVILQPQFFPWVGVFEQIRLADIFVFFDDVQMPRGRSLVKRVQLKTHQGSKWMTVPTHQHSDQAINQVHLDNQTNWRRVHREMLRHNYATAPHCQEMLAIIDEVYQLKTNTLCELNCHAIKTISEWFQLKPTFLYASELNAPGQSSQRLLNLLQQLEATRYITGHGARAYLNHELFEQHGIDVAYMDYQRTPYPQLYGAFNPHVSILDLIANCGQDGSVIQSDTLGWRDVISAS